MRGYAHEKHHALDHLYPSRAAIIEKYGYDPKQLMHLARYKEMVKDFALGKPFPDIWQKVRASLPAGTKAIMIGDTLGTDVYGAYVAGFDSALVVGRNEPATELDADEKLLGVRPTYYLEP